MKITVVGGGNIGTQFAVHSAEKGHQVTLYTSEADKFGKHLNIINKKGETTHEADIDKVTYDAHEAFSDAELIMITVPPNAMLPLSKTIYDNSDANAVIGFVPGNGGFEFAFKNCIERGNVFFGIDRVPAIARITETGKTVQCSGYKDKLYIGALPHSATEECAALIESIYDIPCTRLKGFMTLTLTPSNPILHTSRLKTIFKDYKPGVSYESVPLFYEEWDDESSELLMACDDEIRAICRALPEFGLDELVSEHEFYHSETVSDMTRAISTEPSLLGLGTPTVDASTIDPSLKGLAPDLKSRYFTADFPYGLSVIEQIGRLAGVSTPNIDGLIAWYDELMESFAGDAESQGAVNKKLLLEDYGIKDIEGLRAFYLGN